MGFLMCLMVPGDHSLKIACRCLPDGTEIDMNKHEQ